VLAFMVARKIRRTLFLSSLGPHGNTSTLRPLKVRRDQRSVRVRVMLGCASSAPNSLVQIGDPMFRNFRTGNDAEGGVACL
jgi:hypothetical protein